MKYLVSIFIILLLSFPIFSESGIAKKGKVFLAKLLSFDEDKNGNATVEDVIRVMETHGQMSKEEIETFLKIACGDHHTKESLS